MLFSARCSELTDCELQSETCVIKGPRMCSSDLLLG